MWSAHLFKEASDFLSHWKETSKEIRQPATIHLLASQLIKVAQQENLNLKQDVLVSMLEKIVIIFIQTTDWVFRGSGSIIGENVIVSNKHVFKIDWTAFAYRLDWSRVSLQKRMLHTIDDIAIATVADTPLPTELPKQGQIHELDPQKAYVTIMPFAKKDGGFELILQKVIPGSCIAFSEFDRDILGLTNSEKLNDIQYRIKSEWGTSGSAIFDVESGEVVAIHKGAYKKSNWCAWWEIL